MQLGDLPFQAMGDPLQKSPFSKADLHRGRSSGWKSWPKVLIALALAK